MTWLLRNIPLLVFLFIVFSIVRAVNRAQKLSTQHKAGSKETDEQRRVRQIQERIRRIAAERRGAGVPSTPPPVLREASPPPTRMTLPQPVPPLDPFGGPMRRVERRMPIPAAPAMVETKNAELERQQKLASEIRTLTEARAFAQRRAAEVTAEGKAHAASEGGMLSVARGNLLEDLRDPQSLRRAFVLREVLGPPVGQR